MNGELLFKDGEIRKETKDAMLVGVGVEEYWVPRSVISFIKRKGDSCEIYVEKWWADKNT